MTSTSTAPSLGAWLTLDSVFAAELMVRTGFDWAVIDLQHGALGTDSVVPLLSAVQALASRPGCGRRRRTTHKPTGARHGRRRRRRPTDRVGRPST